jgi:catechol 2,3-dioxygenase-like lactoylglutathione lyase family enzyme
MLVEVSRMSRDQLALNVADIEAAVGFYTKLSGTEPAKRRPGYANFAIVTPPLKLVLIETAESRTSGVPGRSITWASRSTLPNKSRKPLVGWRPRGSPPMSRSRPPAAMRCRTRRG